MHPAEPIFPPPSPAPSLGSRLHRTRRRLGLSRRLLLVWAVLAAALVLLRVVQPLVLDLVVQRWTAASATRPAELSTRAAAVFLDAERQADQLAAQVADELAALMPVASDNRLSSVFSRFAGRSATGGRRYTFELYDPSGRLISWSGRTVGLPEAMLARARAGERFTTTVDQALYGYLCAVRPVRRLGGAVSAILVVAEPLNIRYPVNPLFRRSAVRTAELAADLPYRTAFRFGPGLAPTGDGTRTVSAPLVALDGRTVLGFADIELPRLSGVIESVNRSLRMVRRFGAALLSLWVLAWAVQQVERRRRRWAPVWRLSAVIGLIWATRIALLALTASVLTAGPFDPGLFASRGWLGLGRSLGDLGLTALAAVGSIGYLIRVTLTELRRLEPAPSARLRWTGVALVVVGVLALVPGGRMLLMHAVVDSTLDYRDRLALVPDPALVLMQLSLLGLTASALATVALGAVLLRWGMVRDHWRGVRGAFYTAFGWLLLVALGVWERSAWLGSDGVGPREAGLTWLLGVVLASTVVVVAFHLARSARPLGRSLVTGRRLMLWALLGSALLYLGLTRELDARDRRSMLAVASRDGRTGGGYTTYALERTLELAADEPPGWTAPGADATAAFLLWARSALAEEGYDCTVRLYDPSGTLRSEFSMQALTRRRPTLPVSRLRLLDSARTLGGEPVILSGEDTAPELSVGSVGPAIGSVALYGDGGTGALIGVVLVEVYPASRDGLLVAGEIGRDSDGSPDQPVLYRYVNDTLQTPTPGMPRALPRAVRTELTRTHAPVWRLESGLRGFARQLAYVSILAPGAAPTVVAVQTPAFDLRWHIFTFLKLLLANVLLVLSGYAVWFGGRIVRGHPFRLLFREKIYLILLGIAIVPVGLISYFSRQFVLDRYDATVRAQLAEDLDIIADQTQLLLRASPDAAAVGGSGLIDDRWCAEVARDLHRDFNVFIGPKLVATSRRELYLVEFLDNRLSGSATEALLGEGQPVFFERERAGTAAYIVGYRALLDRRGRPIGAISVPTLYRQGQIDDELATTRAYLFGTFAFVFVLIVVAGSLLSARIAAPIARLNAGMRRVATGQLDQPLEEDRRDEIGDLVRTYNRMVGQLRSSQRDLARAERELAWREMARQIAHEIKNPLTPMKLMAQHLQHAWLDFRRPPLPADGEPTTPDEFGAVLDRTLGVIIEQVETLSRIATEFSSFARLPRRDFERLEVGEVVEEAADLFREQAVGITIQIERSPVPLVVLADREELRRAWINLVKNAIQAMPTGGTLTLRTARAGGGGRVEIADTGTGIAPEVLARLFEPNFSTKSEGMGLGLSIVRKTIEDIGGEITVSSEVGVGTRFTVVLPLVNRAEGEPGELPVAVSDSAR